MAFVYNPDGSNAYDATNMSEAQQVIDAQHMSDGQKQNYLMGLQLKQQAIQMGFPPDAVKQVTELASIGYGPESLIVANPNSTPQQIRDAGNAVYSRNPDKSQGAFGDFFQVVKEALPGTLGIAAAGAGALGLAGAFGGEAAGAASDAGLATAADASAQGGVAGAGGASGGVAGGFAGTPGATAITDPLSGGLTAPGTSSAVGGGLASSAPSGGVGSGIFDKFMESFSKNPIMSSLQILQGGLGVGSGLASILGKGTISPKDAAKAADPFASSRQQYIDKLNAVMANPALAASQPGYQFNLQQGQQQLDRNMAARGQTGTGAGAAAITQYGQDYAMNSYNNYVNQLIGLSGAGKNPADGVNAGLNAQQQALQQNQQGFKAVGQGIGALSTAFGGATNTASAPTAGGGPGGYNATQYTAPIETPAANFNSFGGVAGFGE